VNICSVSHQAVLLAFQFTNISQTKSGTWMRLTFGDLEDDPTNNCASVSRLIDEGDSITTHEQYHDEFDSG
jgi:hypothetical protein